jgi:hypothetical protein
VHFAVFDAVHTPLMQARPPWQLKVSSQREPAGFAAPSQRPPAQTPEQHCSFLLQVIQFGLQRHWPLTQ